MKVRWSRRASADLNEKFAFLEAHDPSAARTMVLTIRAAARELAEAPARWPALEGTRLRKRSVGGYVILYAVGPDIVEIARLHHARENWR